MNIEDILRQPVDDVVTEFKTVTGVQYSRLYQIAHENGFSNQDVDNYLSERGIKIKTPGPPDEPMRNTRLM